MKKVTYSTDTFGNVGQQSCLTGLTNELNKMVEQDPSGPKKARYIARLIQRYHSTLYILSSSSGAINIIKPKLLRHVFEDFSKRVVAKGLPNHLETHILCFLNGLYKSKLRDLRNG